MAPMHGRSPAPSGASVTMSMLLASSQGAVAFQVEGRGELFYEARLKYARRDLPRDEVDRGFCLRKLVRAVAPDALQAALATLPESSQSRVRAGDLVLVDVVLVTAAPREQVVVDDPLPAGLEAVDAAFATTARSLDVADDAFDHREMHDDRVLTFVEHMPAGVRHYRYLARATTPGAYLVPPTKAECMYEPEVFGRNAASKLTPSVGRVAVMLSRAKRAAVAAVLAIVMPIAALVVRAVTLALPPELEAGAPRADSVRFLDRDGRLLREVRADDAARARWIALDQAGDDVIHAVIAAEDGRFYEHPGVDPIAVARAAASDLAHARVVSGASTLTMQLARLVRPHPRTLVGKFDEAALALRVDASLSKSDILEQYVNRAPFGPGVRGIDAASRFWFDKAPRDLSLAEAAALAAIPRGPAVYAIDKHPERVVRRRNRILDRMVRAGWIAPGRAEQARHEPLVARAGKGGFGAPHLVQALVAGDESLGPSAAGADVVQTTIASDLQREIEVAARAELALLAARHITAASVVVIENATGDVLAYVGSPDVGDDDHGGWNDGVRARRQPGSTLKPFVYELAMERLGWTAATLLPDTEMRIAVEGGTYAPTNYDERFHGPVRLRDALASSLNVPAVWAAEQLGESAVLDRLHALGFVSLDQGRPRLRSRHRARRRRGDASRADGGVRGDRARRRVRARARREARGSGRRGGRAARARDAA